MLGDIVAQIAIDLIYVPLTEFGLRDCTNDMNAVRFSASFVASKLIFPITA
jgi:hypothetical protein